MSSDKLKGEEFIVRNMADFIFYKSEPSIFSNFHPAPIVLDGKEWPTSEHYFQAMKYSTMDEDHVERIRLQESPGKAYLLGWKSGKKIRTDWDCVRNDFMKKALYAKFSQHNYLRNELMKTGNRNIIQRSKSDKYWGDGGWFLLGENMLGKLLVEVREELEFYASS